MKLRCPFCKGEFVETFHYSESEDKWYLCHECGKVWDDKPKEEDDENDQRMDH